MLGRHLKFLVLIDTQEYWCMHDIMCSDPRDIFELWEISDNISDKVQNRDIVAMED